MRQLYQAYQRGTGQAVTSALPAGTPYYALRQLLDDKRTAEDVTACARYLKAGYWHDKSLTIARLAEEIGQWISQGRPAKPNGKGTSPPARASPKVNAEGRTYDEHQSAIIRGEIPDGTEWHPIISEAV